jgi:hypothetical protein
MFKDLVKELPLDSGTLFFSYQRMSNTELDDILTFIDEWLRQNYRFAECNFILIFKKKLPNFQEILKSKALIIAIYIEI